jgi:hypothetical protein
MPRQVGHAGLVAMTLLTLLISLAAPAAAGSAGTRRPGGERDASRWEVPPAPVAPEARRRWALARMDDMVAEQRRCRERFRRPADISECEARYARRYRVFNEIYLEASR